MPEPTRTKPPRKENKVERIKRGRDGLDCLDSLMEYARTGFASISEDDRDVRLRWYGLYTQRPEEDGYFMLRLKIPNGSLTCDQLESLGNLSLRYAQNTGDITTRQDIQFHFVRIEDVPEIFSELKRIGLSSSGACGDITRNVTGCPVAGIDAAELIDAEYLVEDVHHHFLGNHDFSNLPRKFKITISGCGTYCTGHEINDIGMIAVLRSDARVAFDLWVGGGLGAKEHFAKRLGAHVFPEEVVEVCHHITAIFRDHGNREFRTRARLKFLVAEWGAERFRTELESRLGRALASGAAPSIPVLDNRAHLGIHPQREQGMFYVGAASKGGLFSGAQMLQVARAARLFGSNRLRLTTAQNLVVLDVPENSCLNLAHALEEVGLQVKPSPFRSGTIACTGKQFCKLAVTETKDRAAEIVAHLEQTLPEFNEPLRISVTGCPNSCAHYQICDIGLVGDLIRAPEGKVDAFRIYLGGHLGDGYSFGRELEIKVRAEHIKFYIERLARVYLERRGETESFQRFIARHESQELEQLVAIDQLTELLTTAEAA